MAQWTKTDDAAGSPIWSAQQFGKAPTRTEANLLFGNTTADSYANATIGMYGVSDAEINDLHFHVLTATANDHGTVDYIVGDFLLVANTLAGDGNTHVEANVEILTVEANTMAINSRGDGGSYVAGEILTLANGVSTTAMTANIDSTEVRTVAVNDGGTGYANADTVTVNQDAVMSTDAVFTLTTGVADTIVASLVRTTNGVFTTNPSLLTAANVTVISSSGTGLLVDLTMMVEAITLEDRGSYTTEPTLTDATVTTTPGDGTGAGADVTMRMLGLGITVEGVYTALVNATANPVTGGSGTGAEVALTLSSGHSDGKIAGSPGWVVRTVGTGGRAGRVQAECIVAIGDMGGDAEDVVFPEFPDVS